MLEPSCLGRDDLIERLSSTLDQAGAVVVGPPAIGVSTVLRKVADRCRAHGAEVRIVRLPDTSPERIEASWPGLLVVDDAHRATAAQAEALSDRALERPVLFGARSGALTGPLDWLWRSGTIERLDLGPLSRALVDALIEARAGGSVHRSLSDAIHHRWDGRPGFLRDDIDALLAGGHLRTFGDVMRATPNAPPSPLAIERVRQLLADLEDRIAADVELLAVVGAPLATTLADLGIDLPALAHHRLTTTVRRSNGEVVRLEPHGLAAAVRANLAPSRHLELARSIDAEVRATLDPTDQVRLAMTLGEPTDLETVAVAARAALRRTDAQLSWALGRYCGRFGPAGLAVEAEVLVEIGLRAEAAKLFQQILDDPETDPATRLSVSIEYSLLLLWDLGRADEAAMITDDLTAATKDTPFQVFTVAHDAAVTLFRGRPVDALEMLRPIGGDDLPAEIRESVAMVRVVSEALTDPATVTGVGSVESLIEEIDTETQGQFESAVSVVAAVLALELAGHLEAALATLHDCRTRMIGQCTPVGTGWLALAQARIELAIGRPVAARRAATEAWAAFEDVMHPSGVRWAAGATVLAAALAGDRAACNDGLATLAALPPGVPFLDADLLRAERGRRGHRVTAPSRRHCSRTPSSVRRRSAAWGWRRSRCTTRSACSGTRSDLASTTSRRRHPRRQSCCGHSTSSASAAAMPSACSNSSRSWSGPGRSCSPPRSPATLRAWRPQPVCGPPRGPLRASGHDCRACSTAP